MILTALLTSLFAVVNGSTVAVLEIGKGGVVRRTTTTSPSTSTAGVVSFLKSVHQNGNENQSRDRRVTQHAGMGVVPDLFNSADGGIAIGIVGNIDLASMPNVADLLENGSVGQMQVKGNQGHSILSKFGRGLVNSDSFELSSRKAIENAVHKEGNTLESMTVKVENDESAAKVDSSLIRILKELEELMKSTDKTVLVHLIVDEEEGAARRRLISRRLKEGESEDEILRQLEDEDEDEDNEDENNNDASSAYGYVNDYGEYVIIYKSMFNIQYFNIVLWTSLGLLTVFGVSTYMMLTMPLLPDTLLFGESAKVDIAA